MSHPEPKEGISPRPTIRAIDTETTGFSEAQGNRLLQIGSADLEPDGKIRRNMVRYVHPGDIDPEITHRPWLTARAIKRGTSPEKAAKLFKGAKIYAMHKADFDWPLLSPYLGPAQIICTLKCAQVLAPSLPSHTCSALYIGLTGEDPGKIHKAGKDAKMCAVILDALLKTAPITTLLEITRGDVICFGKHKYKLYSEIEATHPDYIDWLANNKDMWLDVRETAQTYIKKRECGKHGVTEASLPAAQPPEPLHQAAPGPALPVLAAEAPAS